MNLNDGKYCVYFVADGNEKVGEFEVKSNNITILSDPDGHLNEMIPSGPLTPKHRRQFMSIAHSGYWRILPLKESKKPSLKAYIK